MRQYFSQLLLQLLSSVFFLKLDNYWLCSVGASQPTVAPVLAATAVYHSCLRGPPDSLISCALLQAHEEHAVGQ